jgi:putative ABC transport system permease protein
MLLTEPIIMAFQSLWANKLRSALTLLGVIIGVFTIIGMQSVVAGFRENVHEELSILGGNTFQVQKYPAVNVGGDNRSQYRNREDLTYDQAMAIQEYAVHVQAVGVENWDWGNEITFRDRKTTQPISVAGATPEFALANGYFVEYGRFLTESDILHTRNVTVIGVDVVEDLFPFEDPIGAQVKIQGRPFTVVGIFEERGASFGESRDNRAVIPYSTWEKMYGSDRSVNITVRAASTEQYTEAMDEVISILRTVRKVPPGEPNNFEIFSSETLKSSFDDMTKMVRYAAIGIASISLIVAGIGIMNIMLVTVTERTREIGIRKAIGAKRMDIMIQFLIESVILSLIGGLIGVLIGVAIAQGLSSATNLPAIVPTWAILVALIFCSFIGLFFGMYPAAKASKLDPIESLRYE